MWLGLVAPLAIGNSGPLAEEVTDAIREGDLMVSGVLSGNRNFEGRIHPDVPANYLASPPLGGRLCHRWHRGSRSGDRAGLAKIRTAIPFYLKDIWPSQKEIADVIEKHINSKMYREQYANVFEGSKTWQNLPHTRWRDLRVAGLHLCPQPPVFRGNGPRAGRSQRDQTGSLLGQGG